MGLLATLQAIATAMQQVITLTGQVIAELDYLKSFLNDV